MHLLVLGTGFSSSRALPEGWHELVIGRDPDVDVTVDERSVSRRHAVLTVGPKLFVKDLGTANGTYLHNVKLSPESPVEIQVGDVIRLGYSVALVIQKGGKDRSFVPEGPPSVGREPPATLVDGAPVVVAAESMKVLHQLLKRVARGSINVLFLGETGVGKEVAARLLHAESPRGKKPFVAINCASFTETLLENELFGHEAGAFTGAQSAKPGLLESAHGGTVFLDEIGEMPLPIQAKLLRVVEDRSVTRLGAVKSRPLDVRFLSATNRALEDEVDAGRFRRDLYFRLNGIPLLIPPLRERTAEIEPLAREFIRSACEGLGRRPPDLAPEALEALKGHPLPGNVRELRNVIERAVLLCEGRTIEPVHLCLEKKSPAIVEGSSAPNGVESGSERKLREAKPVAPQAPRGDKLRDEVESLERERMLAALEACGGNQTHAAEKLGVSRRAFVMKMDRYGIPRPRRKKPD
jgi:DNA-binding NtrC family response regulator